MGDDKKAPPPPPPPPSTVKVDTSNYSGAITEGLTVHKGHAMDEAKLKSK